MQGSGFDDLLSRQAEDAHLRVVFELTAVGVAEVDIATSRFLQINPRYCEIVGYSRDELLEKTFEELTYTDDLPAAQAVWRALETHQTSYSLEKRFVHRDGSLVWAEVTVVPFAIAGGARHTVATVVDISQRKRVEAARDLEQEERRRLEAKVLHRQKLESLGVLAGGIAHDFNNLLVGILGNAELALEQLDGESPPRESIETIQQTAQRAAELTNQMLAYSGRGKLTVEQIRLEVLVPEMLQLLETVISKKAELRCTFADGIPPIDADPTQLRQLVMNLVTNASEALGEEAGTIDVRTKVVELGAEDLATCVASDAASAGPHVVLEVVDSGCGMSEAQRERIFDPFFTTKFTGRGLGLAATLGIVRGHGGAIRVESEPGRGSRFSVFFPAALVRGQKETPSEVSTATATGLVLLVDDEAVVRAAAARMLRHLGFEVQTASDGEEALQVLQQQAEAIALVLLDLTMPRLDGAAVLRELRRQWPRLPVLLMSGYTAEDSLGRFTDGEPTGFIQKPFTLKLLREQIAAALGG